MPGKAVALPAPPLGRGVSAVKRATLARVQGGKPCWVNIGNGVTFVRVKPLPRRAQYDVRLRTLVLGTSCAMETVVIESKAKEVAE